MGTEKTKISNSYYLDVDNITWLSKKADKESRSASWYLNEILKKLRSGKQ